MNLGCVAIVSTALMIGCGGDESAKKQPASNPKTEVAAKSTDAGSKKIGAVQTSSSTMKSGNSKKTDSDSNRKAEPQPEPPKPKKKVKPPEPDLNEPEFHESLTTALEEYLRYGMVNSVALAAPGLCAPAPNGPIEPAPLMSASEDDTSHGEKLYFLFAKDISHYMGQESPAPVGQTIVKESWSSVESNPNARNLRNHASGNRINPRTKVGDKVMEIGARKNFFIMTKLDKDTPKTDQGWVYGIIDSDSRKVIASGKVASCIYCHVDAGNDRMFGPADAFVHNQIISTEEIKSDDSASDSDTNTNEENPETTKTNKKPKDAEPKDSKQP